MENVVASRKLRKSSINSDNFINEFDINSIMGTNDIKRHSYSRLNRVEINSNDNTKNIISYKLIIKIFLSVLLIFCTLIGKLIFFEDLNQNEYFKIAKEEYSKDYEKMYICEKIEDLTLKTYKSLNYIIPEEIANRVCTIYLNHIKPNVINFNIKDICLKIVGKNDIKNNELAQDISFENMSLNGVGGGEPITEEQTVKKNQTKEEKDIEDIKQKNINIIKPVSGIITSNYGQRDEIFAGVNPYHTGIDIANSANTPIYSATSGKVIKIEENNKYYGNNIEIETNGVIFKYAHLNKILVSKDQEIPQNYNIGLMGSTGMSTGPHLHLEIKIENKTVDPLKIYDFSK